MNLSSGWSIQDSIDTYGINNWGKGYFSINPDGNVAVHPEKNPQRAIDLKKLVDQLIMRDIQLPTLVRFSGILRHRLAEMHDAFQSAIQEILLVDIFPRIKKIFHRLRNIIAGG